MSDRLVNFLMGIVVIFLLLQAASIDQWGRLFFVGVKVFSILGGFDNIG